MGELRSAIKLQPSREEIKLNCVIVQHVPGTRPSLPPPGYLSITPFFFYTSGISVEVRGRVIVVYESVQEIDPSRNNRQVDWESDVGKELLKSIDEYCDGDRGSGLDE